MHKIILLLFLIISIASVSRAGQKPLKLGIVPFKGPRTVVELYTPVASLLSKALEREVQVVTATGYKQYMQRVYDTQYDIIVLGSTFYFKARDKAGYRAVARGYPPFHAGIIALKSSKLDDIKQLRGATMAAVNSADRGGYTLQKMALLQQGIDIEKDITVHFRGDIDSVIYAVLSGQDESGAIRLDALQKLSFAGVKDKIKIIYTSPANPQFPIAVRADMPLSMQEKIGRALESINLEQPEHAVILQNLGIHGFERITNKDMNKLQRHRQEEAKKIQKSIPH